MRSKKHGELFNILVSNAGLHPHLTMFDDVDLNSVFYCLKYEIPEMIKSGYGAIVNTASTSGFIGGYNPSVYTAAKHGVVGLKID